MQGFEPNFPNWKVDSSNLNMDDFELLSQLFEETVNLSTYMLFEIIGTNSLVKLFVKPFLNCIFYFADPIEICKVFLQFIAIWSHILGPIIIAYVWLIRNWLQLQRVPLKSVWLCHAHHRNHRNPNRNTIIDADWSDRDAVAADIWKLSVEFSLFLMNPLPAWFAFRITIKSKSCSLKCAIPLTSCHKLTYFTLECFEHFKPEDSVNPNNFLVLIRYLLMTDVSTLQFQLSSKLGLKISHCTLWLSF